MRILRKLYFILLVTIQWVPSYIIFNFKKKEKPVHILFCLGDHFEPGTRGVSIEIEKQRMSELMEKYPQIAKKHKDFYGNMPGRTWFFPPHYHRYYNLKQLVSLCEQGFGEIELHLHHGKTRPDNAENLKKTLQQCILEYGHFGIFGTQDGGKKYGFIHGNWALDNSAGGQNCGVNNELQILNETGCYADFTFPAPFELNTKQINSIYYAADDPNKPKSHDKGIPVRKDGKKSGDLMIIQGPLHPFFFSNKIARLRAPGDEITGEPPVTNKRVDFWVKTGIHVKGKTNWLFIKTHTHGAVDSKAVLGDEIDNIFYYLETQYNDGHNYILHYVTARELYNIVKAVEAGETGTDPEEYRNYLVKKPAYDSSPDIPEASNILKDLIAKTYEG
jgi:hypothetical protein